jgi:hypothetical protein
MLSGKSDRTPQSDRLMLIIQKRRDFHHLLVPGFWLYGKTHNEEF